MFQLTLSAHVRRLTGLFAAVALLGAALGTAQSTAASTSRGQAGSRLQQTPGYSLPLSRQIIPRSEYDDPHHDYPAIDIEVAEGTKVWAVRGGTAQRIYQADGCGKGIQITATDGAVYTYCHLSAYAVADGERVFVAQTIGLSGNTGRSDGPHLHLQIKVNGVKRCPQPLLLAIYDGAPAPAPSTLPTSGCSY